jgi:hypothetical protein
MTIGRAGAIGLPAKRTLNPEPDMSCSWIALMLAGLGLLTLAGIAILFAVGLGLRCYGAGLFDRFLPQQSPDEEPEQARG